MRGFGAEYRPHGIGEQNSRALVQGAYLASYWHKNDPAATTETRLLWKMKKGKSEFATEQDVVAKPVGQVIGTYSPEPFLLSDKATAEGWATVMRGRRQDINSAKLNTFLEQEIYDGNELWQFFLQPVLGLATLVFVLLVFRAWRQERWERGWWKQNQPQLSFWAWSDSGILIWPSTAV